MKTLHPSVFRLAVVTALFLCQNIILSQNCNYIWQLQSAGTGQAFYSVKAINENVCWISGGGATVIRTTNGGINWINANPNPGTLSGDLKNIEAISTETAWVSTSSGLTTNIYRTTNAGFNWTLVYTNNGGFVKSIEMVSSTEGYAIGDAIGTLWNVLKTTDGGLTWFQLPSLPTATVSESTLPNCFQVSLPFMWFGSSFGGVYRTSNSGASWTFHPTPGINIYVLALHFNEQNLGYAAAQSMVKSTNAGMVFNVNPCPGAGNIDGIESYGNDVWFVRGTGIYRSTDAGNSWTQVHTAAQTQMHIDFPNGFSGCRMGWSVGFGGTIYKMTDNPLGITKNNEIPAEFMLEQNYPNPFNPVTNINYSLPVSDIVHFDIYDMNGRVISTPVNGYQSAGKYSITFDASNLASGMYFYRLVSGSFNETKKMLLIK